MDYQKCSEMLLDVSELLQTNLADLAIPERAQVGARHLMVFGPSAFIAARLLEEEIGNTKPVTVFMGSSFPGDRSIGAIYQGIAKIKRSMEMGGCVMLVHCEDIYESLYDMLNQLLEMVSKMFPLHFPDVPRSCGNHTCCVDIIRCKILSLYVCVCPNRCMYPCTFMEHGFARLEVHSTGVTIVKTTVLPRVPAFQKHSFAPGIMYCIRA